jgi:hypothetical protein
MISSLESIQKEISRFISFPAAQDINTRINNIKHIYIRANAY